MGKHQDSGRIDLHRADLAASVVFEHPTSRGAATESHWIRLFNAYLPERYRATSAFILDTSGRRSRRIDLAVYDRPHIPAESVYAVFEIKQTLAAKCILDAGRKVASVRRLRRTSAPLLSAGSVSAPKPIPPILSDAVWAGPDRIGPFLRRLRPEERLDLGCCLRRGAFELDPGSSSVRFSRPGEALIFFFLRLLQRLQDLGTAPALHLADYARVLDSPPSS